MEKGKPSVHKLNLVANSIRQEIIKSLLSAASGHSAGPLGMADVYTALYFSVMKVFPGDPWNDKRDRMIISNGHICPVLYAALAVRGYFPVNELKTLRHLGTRLQGHPHKHGAPGVENPAGPLGQGISMACGAALSAKMDGKKHSVYVSMGDGEINEGQAWEGFLFAAKYKLDNLVGFLDRNYIQIDGDTREVMPLDPLDKKFESFGWHVIDIDANDMEQVLDAFARAAKIKGKPTLIMCNTVPGKGVSFMEGDYHWHGNPPNEEQAKIALDELGKEQKRLENVQCKGCGKQVKGCDC